MKKKIATAILIAAASMAFANESTPPHSFSATDLPMEKKIGVADKVSSTKQSFTYLRMGVADEFPTTSAIEALPGLGLGYRLGVGSGAVDISANYTRGHWAKENDLSTYFYTLPKASYLHYLSPKSNQSLYAGVGLAFGGMRKMADTQEIDEKGNPKIDEKGNPIITATVLEFTGLIPSATIGYEMSRNANVRSFVQLDVSQPAVATSDTLNVTNWTSNSDFFKKAPFAEISLGIGY